MQDTIATTPSTSTSTISTTVDWNDSIPILLHRFKNLNHLLPSAMASYALPQAHKDVRFLPLGIFS